MPLAQPSLKSKLDKLDPGPDAGYSFIMFGDQRALAGEWDAMMQSIDSLSQRDPRLAFMLDTGDIVNDGNFTDQFHLLAGILARAKNLPYLVGVGNHELNNNATALARQNTATFLKPIDSVIDPGRLYYVKKIGRVRFLFLDSNDLVYETGAAASRRRNAQLSWLVEQLRSSPDKPGSSTIVVMHHPILQSSQKHREQARALWSLAYNGRSFADILADGGVDILLVGHTHTYERFRAVREDGKGFLLINLSGRPLPVFFGMGDGARRANEIPTGGGRIWFLSRGWQNLTGWDISQEDAMLRRETDQFAVFNVEADGGITMKLRYMNRPGFESPVRLLFGAGKEASGSPAAAPGGAGK